MSQVKNAQDMKHVEADIGQVAGIFRSFDVQGPMKDYVEKRIAGEPIDPGLARNAFVQAKQLADEAKAKGARDSSLRGVSVGILDALLYDLSAYVKQAAARETIKKLASKFELALK